MTTSGVDYSWARPDPTELADLGYTFACRYVSWDDTGKNLTHGELADLSDAGIAVVLNWEYYADAASGGWTQGVNDASAALDQANNLGCPDDCPIYFSIDFDMTSNQIETVGEYFAGIQSVLPLYRIGVYGSYDAIDAAVNGQWASWFWQTYAWSGDQVHPANHIYQHTNNVTVAGGAVDLNYAYADDIGAWGLFEEEPSPPVSGCSAEDVWAYSLTGELVAEQAVMDIHAAAVVGIPDGLDTINARLDTIQSTLDTVVSILTAQQPPPTTPDPCEQHMRAIVVDEISKVLPVASPVEPGRHRGEW